MLSVHDRLSAILQLLVTWLITFAVPLTALPDSFPSSWQPHCATPPIPQSFPSLSRLNRLNIFLKFP